MYEGTVSIRVCSCSREHIAPISARRVSGSRGHRPFLASPLALPCAPQIARVHTILLSATSSSSLFPETSPFSPPPASFYLAARVHPCTDVHFCAPWRVSKDGEIRFAPRENGVIIYEGGNKKKGINQRGGRGGGYFCQKLRWSEKGLRKLASSPSIPRNRGRTRSSENARAEGVPRSATLRSQSTAWGGEEREERGDADRTFRSFRHSGDPVRGHAPPSNLVKPPFPSVVPFS